jgi:hypothetical protein
LCRQLKYFKKVRNEIPLLTRPFSFDVENSPDNFQLDQIDVQSDNRMKDKIISAKCADISFFD